MKVLIASRNRHKIEEIKAIFALPGVEWVCAADVPGLKEVDEDGETFEENAAKKARECAKATGMWTLADDSGLEVRALADSPGVRSARFAGEPCDHAKNNAKLLDELDGSPDRTARFRCVAALSDPKGKVQTVSGACPGKILTALRGVAGFGYDPLFVPDGEKETFAEMGNDRKNAISHRGRAMALAKAKWGALLASGAGEFPA